MVREMLKPLPVLGLLLALVVSGHDPHMATLYSSRISSFSSLFLFFFQSIKILFYYHKFVHRDYSLSYSGSIREKKAGDGNEEGAVQRAGVLREFGFKETVTSYKLFLLRPTKAS